MWPAPVGRFFSGDTGAVDHVETARQQRVDQQGRRARIIGVVAVDHDINVGVDVGEHPAHDTALAQPGVVADDRAGFARGLGRAVGRVVVVDMDLRLRQQTAEVADHLGDRRNFVETGDEDRQDRLARSWLYSRAPIKRGLGQVHNSLGHDRAFPK